MGRKIIPESEYNKIAELYNNGMSSVQIGTEYGCDYKTIIRILDKLNINRDTSKYREYNLNTNYFDVIDTQDKAYILGFLYADGCVSLSRRTISLSLQESDMEILEKMNICLGYDRPLEIVSQKNHKQPKDGTNYHYCNMAYLRIFNKAMCEKLISLGVLENKSLLLEFPYWMKEELYPHFIRGYFDGDGSFCSRIAKGYGRRDLITFTSTETFCKALRTVLKYVVGIPGGNIYDASCHNGITKVLSISGYYQTKVLLDWMYSDANLYLKRKHDLYLEKFYS